MVALRREIREEEQVAVAGAVAQHDAGTSMQCPSANSMQEGQTVRMGVYKLEAVVALAVAAAALMVHEPDIAVKWGDDHKFLCVILVEVHEDRITCRVGCQVPCVPHVKPAAG